MTRLFELTVYVYADVFQEFQDKEGNFIDTNIRNLLMQHT